MLGTARVSTAAEISRKELRTTKPIWSCSIQIQVVPLVRHGPGTSLHNHRQAPDQRLADAARARLADEKVGQFHIERNLAREALDPLRNPPIHARSWEITPAFLPQSRIS